MTDADTWATLLLVDAHDERVLAEAVVGFKLEGDEYVIAEPPIELTIMQAGQAGFIVVMSFAGMTVARVPYRKAQRMLTGDAIRIRQLRVPKE